MSRKVFVTPGEVADYRGRRERSVSVDDTGVTLGGNGDVRERPIAVDRWYLLMLAAEVKLKKVRMR